MGFTVFMRSNPDFPAFNQALNASLNGNATGFAYVPIFDIRETVVVPLLCSDFRTFFFFFLSVKRWVLIPWCLPYKRLEI
jgi:hypothetical protein